VASFGWYGGGGGGVGCGGVSGRILGAVGMSSGMCVCFGLLWTILGRVWLGIVAMCVDVAGDGARIGWASMGLVLLRVSMNHQMLSNSASGLSIGEGVMGVGWDSSGWGWLSVFL